MKNVRSFLNDPLTFVFDLISNNLIQLIDIDENDA